MLDKALATVQPLALPAAATGGYMEGLRKRGEAVMLILAKHVREEGNALFKKAATVKGKEQERVRNAAARQYVIASYVPDESSVCFCNAAAVYLLLEE